MRSADRQITAIDLLIDLLTGCPPQPTCGLNVSPSLSAVLNANLQLCGVFRTCEVRNLGCC